ncbi:sensor histidine kinase [Microbacterium oleivorans]|uniref:histidine kinase n=1 Tax=Microbacterium oleivorans TaxID=273677 RepID=A0A7D5IV14_9MICO|nr:HAMP domain-containing sensor histidine kinase [Microbacterium oleivorans]QLD10822.1 HAMP domain-containing histidine kinase [Microbacterium oleivorans]
MTVRARSLRRTPLALKLTLISTAAFTLAAAVLLAVEYAMLQYVVEVSIDATTGSSSQGQAPNDLDGSTAVFRVAHDLASTVMLISAITATVMVALAGAAVWLVARRSLGRVADLTELTRRITGENLDERLRLTGPRDEISELGDTIDDMLQRLHAAFEQQDRFVANASHELRTPLAGIRASLEQSLMHDAVPPRPEVAMRRALEATERSERLLTALLQLARSRRLPTNQLQTIDLAETVEAAIDLVQSEASAAGHSFDVQLEGVQIEGDTVLVMQAAHNLVLNAVRHGATSSPITVRVSCSGQDGALTISNGGETLNGETVAKLVEPFNRGAATRQTQRHAAGTGLGLAIVQSIAVQHDGHLDLAPRPGGGLTARLRLPRAEPVAVST